jgi:hypothetical protein
MKVKETYERILWESPKEKGPYCFLMINKGSVFIECRTLAEPSRSIKNIVKCGDIIIHYDGGWMATIPTDQKIDELILLCVVKIVEEHLHQQSRLNSLHIFCTGGMIYPDLYPYKSKR